MNNKSHNSPVQNVMLNNVTAELKRIAKALEELLEIVKTETEEPELEPELEEEEEEEEEEADDEEEAPYSRYL